MSISGTSNHTFVICAYKESEHLEDCIKSLLKQTVAPTVRMVTSTPNEHIIGLSKKYDIDLSVREMEIANRQFGVTFSCEKGTVYMDMDEVPYDGEGGLSL